LRDQHAAIDNQRVPSSPWSERSSRAEELGRAFPFAAELLSFYSKVARLQQECSARWEQSGRSAKPNQSLPEAIGQDFRSFLIRVGEVAPRLLQDCAGLLAKSDAAAIGALLHEVWRRPELVLTEPKEFLARAFLQPLAVATQSKTDRISSGQRVCPSCGRKPSSGVLRPQGDGGIRSLVCSFCLGEWEFRRILCPGCGEEDHKKLPVYTAADFEYIRVECCDSCKQYLKTIDLTKNGLADPVVDEIASAPLDLWAREQGYAKIETNLLGM